MTPALADYTTLGLGGRARSFVSAATEADLIDAVKAADAAAEPVLLIGGGSNLVISDAGFPGTVIHVNTRGIGYADAPEGTDAGRRRRRRHRRGGRGLGRRGRGHGRRGPGRARVAVRHPRPGGRDPDPERRRLRPRGGRGHHPGAGVRPPGRSDSRPRERGLLLRLPHQPVQIDRGAVRGPRRDVPAGRAGAVAAGEVRRAGGRARRGAGGAGGRRRGPLGRAQDPRPQGDGAQPGRPGHPQRRLLLHQPDHHRRRLRRGGGRRGRPRGRPGAQATTRAPAW